MNLDTKINLALAIASFVLAATSVITVVITLLQNHRMIESSTRPYLGIYTTRFFISGNPPHYIVLKNFGQSSALIKEFYADIDLSKLSLSSSVQAPFSGLIGSEIMPGQSFKTIFNYEKALSESEIIHFTIKYTSSTKKYCDTFALKLTSNKGNFSLHAENKNDVISLIAETLQEIHINSL